MSRSISVVMVLAAVLLAGAAVQAQVVPPTEPADPDAEQDAGVLQAELARVEAERQRLEDELAGGQPQRLEQLEVENTALRERLDESERASALRREEDRQRWFIIGGSTVAISLLVGLILGRSGGRNRRREWLN
jgi:hypothetical protein